MMNEKFWNIDKIINQYYLGDCIEILPYIPDNTFDLIILDPPYSFPAKHYQTRKDFKRTLGDFGLLEHFFKNVFREVERVLKDTGFLYVFCNEESYPLFWFYCFFFAKKIRMLIWNKITSINGYHWRHQYEVILFAIMFNSPKVKTGDGDILKCRAVHKDEREHPAQKPEEIITKLIMKSSSPNQLIGDFFAGSGIVLKIAKKLGRNYFGIEYDEFYYEKSKKQLEAIELIAELPSKEIKTLDKYLEK